MDLGELSSEALFCAYGNPICLSSEFSSGTPTRSFSFTPWRLPWLKQFSPRRSIQNGIYTVAFRRFRTLQVRPVFSCSPLSTSAVSVIPKYCRMWVICVIYRKVVSPPPQQRAHFRENWRRAGVRNVSHADDCEEGCDDVWLYRVVGDVIPTTRATWKTTQGRKINKTNMSQHNIKVSGVYVRSTFEIYKYSLPRPS